MIKRHMYLVICNMLHVSYIGYVYRDTVGLYINPVTLNSCTYI